MLRRQTEIKQIEHESALLLPEYPMFRHLFRHPYGYELQWEKLRPLAEQL
ncbi:MAG: hypothetical protein RMK18_05965 [Armatimonadota bacterium]|nr:hypothetical protein [Armatimonadota bacterium]MCX7777338.1 hypothetical protein [Armatimonadota bacterium]MDW8025394.1 hypothetical protein [Armatimonadota bacterium]